MAAQSMLCPGYWQHVQGIVVQGENKCIKEEN
jgi:hypothetical protein